MTQIDENSDKALLNKIYGRILVDAILNGQRGYIGIDDVKADPISAIEFYVVERRKRMEPVTRSISGIRSDIRLMS